MEEACGQAPEPEVDVLNDNNIELVATLLETFDTAEGPRIPNSLLLPPDSVQDECRWLSSWPELVSSGPSEEWDRKWRSTVKAAYERFGGHWAAAVAYHF